MFRFDGRKVEYSYSKNYQGILTAESMFVDGKPVFKRADGKFTIDTDSFPIDKSMQRNLADNANNIPIVNFLLMSIPLARDHYFNKDCQVFTSSHNTYLMTNDLLRPDCNFILNENKIKPLVDCTEKELRFGHNIEKMFRGNAFKV